MELLNLIEIYSKEEIIDLLVYHYSGITEQEIYDLFDYLERNEIIQK